MGLRLTYCGFRINTLLLNRNRSTFRQSRFLRFITIYFVFRVILMADTVARLSFTFRLSRCIISIFHLNTLKASRSLLSSTLSSTRSANDSLLPFPSLVSQL
ncbi:hypothetical protein HanXRQr2_Chr13g0588231 [Helianthus annuus]|uniref:Uncharacterized protein n=1 Tax=Helianthus annuus TaxID=4232 RepID=A0A9K3EJZ8_HELAN|nr:hypothetical protein HanXRQr2_Chr13g0588231 [Helianthus annuus]